MPTKFSVDSRLASDTSEIDDLALCRILLMNDARFPWVILVPKRVGVIEILDLGEFDRTLLMREIAQIAAALRGITDCDKLNVAALGNVVAQLHVHVVARFRHDAAWPRPVWAQGQPQPYEPEAREKLVARLRAKIPRV